MLLCCRISVSGANFPCTQGLILLESVLHNWHQRDSPVTLRGLRDFVRVRGGGYFFMPAKRTVGFLARMPRPAHSVLGFEHQV